MICSVYQLKTTQTLSLFYKTTNPEEEEEDDRRGKVIIVVPRKIRFLFFLKGKLKIRLLSPHCSLSLSLSDSNVSFFSFRLRRKLNELLKI